MRNLFLLISVFFLGVISGCRGPVTCQDAIDASLKDVRRDIAAVKKQVSPRREISNYLVGEVGHGASWDGERLFIYLNTGRYSSNPDRKPKHVAKLVKAALDRIGAGDVPFVVESVDDAVKSRRQQIADIEKEIASLEKLRDEPAKEKP
jgi:hypothetical protein